MPNTRGIDALNVRAVIISLVVRLRIVLDRGGGRLADAEDIGPLLQYFESEIMQRLPHAVSPGEGRFEGGAGAVGVAGHFLLFQSLLGLPLLGQLEAWVSILAYLP